MKKKVLKVLTGIGGLGIAFCIALGTSAVAVSAETEYEYDDLNRLTEERHDDGTVIYYSYDANGNLLDVEVKDGNDTENKKPDEGSDQNSGGNQNNNAGGQGGADLGNGGNHDGERNPEDIGKGENGKSDSGQENVSEDYGENGIKDPSEDSREGTGGNGFESGVGDEKAEGVSENSGGRGAVIAKALTALVVLIAAVSGGIFIWKRRKKNEKGEDD